MLLKKSFFLFLLIIFKFNILFYAQDDLFQELENLTKVEIENPIEIYTLKTFNGTRIVNLHSIETLVKRSLMFQIQHRFGSISSGFQALYGLDLANVRLSLSYGITDDLTVEIGRDKFNATYDGIVKYRVLKQKNIGQPISITTLFTTAIQSRNNTLLSEKFSRRIAYTLQAMIARKFNKFFSFQISPTMVHRNYVPTRSIDNTILAIGFGTRIKLATTMHLIADYTLSLGNDAIGLTSPLGIGFEWVTGGHVFQLHFTNADAMHENGFIRETINEPYDLHFGFNITRIFPL